VYGWGDNSFGQLGTGAVGGNYILPQRVTSSNNILIGKQVVAIASGYAHSLALDSTGCIYSWGNNEFGQLGVNGNQIGTSAYKVSGASGSLISLTTTSPILSIAYTLGTGIHKPSYLTRLREAFDWHKYDVSQPESNYSEAMCDAAIKAYPGMFSENKISIGIGNTVDMVLITSANFVYWLYPADIAIQTIARVKRCLWVLEQAIAFMHFDFGFNFGHVLHYESKNPIMTHRISVFINQIGSYSTLRGGGASVGDIFIDPIHSIRFCEQVIGINSLLASVPVTWHEAFHCIQTLVPYFPPDWKISHEGTAQMAQLATYYDYFKRSYFVQLPSVWKGILQEFDAYSEFVLWYYLCEHFGGKVFGNFFTKFLPEVRCLQRIVMLIDDFKTNLDLMGFWCRNYLYDIIKHKVDFNTPISVDDVLSIEWDGMAFIQLTGLSTIKSNDHDAMRVFHGENINGIIIVYEILFDKNSVSFTIPAPLANQTTPSYIGIATAKPEGSSSISPVVTVTVGAMDLITLFVDIRDTSNNGLSKSNSLVSDMHPGFAYNNNERFTIYMQSCSEFSVNGSPWLTYVSRKPTIWYGKDVIKYGPSIEPKLLAFAVNKFVFKLFIDKPLQQQIET
jgi:hypothetical protein